MKRHYPDFNSYRLEDFIEDQHFLLWATQPDDQTNAYWAEVIKSHPQQATVIAEAKAIINAMRFEVNVISAAESQLLWENIADRLVPSSKQRFFSIWLRVAATLFIGVALSIAILYYTSYQKLVVRTGYGQTKTVKLPDGTTVQLNANSEISYPKKWDKDHIREVWIEGEAFFSVSHLHKSGLVTPGQRFIVHAKKVNIEVLGTTFNVKQRRESIKVVLVTGKVSMGITSLGKSLIMKPGELAEYDESKNSIVRSLISPPDDTSWKEGKLQFENTPVTEVFKYIEDTYGYKVILLDPEIGNKKLSGTFATSNEQTLLKALSKTLGISIEANQQKRELTIKN